MRLIDADALIEKLDKDAIKKCFITDAGGVIKLLAYAPTVERKTDTYNAGYKDALEVVKEKLLHDIRQLQPNQIQSITIYNRLFEDIENIEKARASRWRN